MLARVLVLFAFLALPMGAWAQNYQRITTCGTGSPPAGVSPGYMDADGNVCVTVDPSNLPGSTPVHSTALEASHVLKATPGNLYSVYASNLTGGTTGFLVIYNATSAPSPGALTGSLVLDCVPFSGGAAQIVSGGIPPTAYSVGITALVTSATTCLTYTTGTLTAYIKAIVQ